jgi:hypothetical protein
MQEISLEPIVTFEFPITNNTNNTLVRTREVDVTLTHLIVYPDVWFGDEDR